MNNLENKPLCQGKITCCHVIIKYVNKNNEEKFTWVQVENISVTSVRIDEITKDALSVIEAEHKEAIGVLWMPHQLWNILNYLPANPYKII